MVSPTRFRMSRRRGADVASSTLLPEAPGLDLGASQSGSLDPQAADLDSGRSGLRDDAGRSAERSSARGEQGSSAERPVAAAAALRHAGHGARGQWQAPMTPSWQLLDVHLSNYQRASLRRLMRFCSAQGIAPAAVDDTILADFRTALEADGRIKQPRAKVQSAARVWNHCRGSVPGWPQRTLAVPTYRETYTLDRPALCRTDARGGLAHAVRQPETKGDRDEHCRSVPRTPACSRNESPGSGSEPPMSRGVPIQGASMSCRSRMRSSQLSWSSSRTDAEPSLTTLTASRKGVVLVLGNRIGARRRGRWHHSGEWHDG